MCVCVCERERERETEGGEEYFIVAIEGGTWLLFV